MVAERQAEEPIDPLRRLTPTQRRVLFAYGRLGSITEVALELGIGRQTTKHHLTEIYQRLNVLSGVQAMYVALGGPGVVLDNRPASAPPLGIPARMPVMVDGQITVEQLEAAARLGDSEADISTRATLSECVAYIKHYVRSPGARSSVG